MKPLVLGATGQLGSDIIKIIDSNFFSKNKKIKINYLKKNEIINLFEKYKPKIIINCIAYTDVNNADKNKFICKYLNSDLPDFIAKECRKRGILLMHFSTDYVFDGKNKNLISEKSKTNPINYYGKTKLNGDLNIIKSKCDYFIFRLSWLYNINYKNNFVNKVIKKVNENKQFTLPSNEIGAPISTRYVAKCIKKILNLSSLKKKTGIYNLTTNGYASRYDIGNFILKILKKKNKIIPIEIKNSKSNLINRPLNSKLKLNKIENLLNQKNKTWKQDLKENFLIK